jgi:protein-tyrosine phosphatase
MPASKILSYLYIGSRQDAKDKKNLTDMNIKYVLNCTPKRSDDPESGCPNFYEKDKTFVYKRIPIFDNKGEDILPHIDSAYKFIEEGKHYGGILVHCHKGVSRSASFVIGYLMRKNELTLEEALAHVKSCRPVVQPNSSFLSQLETFQKLLNSPKNIDEALTISKKRTIQDMSPSESDIGPVFAREGTSSLPSVELSVPNDDRSTDKPDEC